MSSTRRRAAWVVLLVALVSGCAGDETSSVVPPSVTIDVPHTVLAVEEFTALLDDPDVLVVNVHMPYEGELPGTDALVAYDQVLKWDGLPKDRDAPLAVYCMSGNMSQQAARSLVAAGYTDVRELDGGMLAWQDSGRDLVTPDRSVPSQG